MRCGYLMISALALGVAVSGAANAGPTISTNVVPGVNFSAYKTYTWVAPVSSVANPVMYQRIQADFDAALAGLGYQKGDPGDLSMIITTGAQQRTDVQSWGRFGMQTSVYQYTQGQLSLDVFDTKTQQALWHGQASQTVNPDKPNLKAIDAAIAKLMLQFPPTAAPAPSTPPR